MTKNRPDKYAYIVAQRIVHDINEAGLEPGARLLPERDMLEKYEVGRGTLRESLRFLELNGVLSLRPGPNGGPIVERPPYDALGLSSSLLLQARQAPFRIVIEARHVLEPRIAELAASRMTDNEIQELKEIVKNLEAEVDDQGRFLEQSRRFHAALARGSGNDLFAYLFHSIMGILDGAAIGMKFTQRGRQATAIIQSQICDAISARDAKLAGKLMQEYMDTVQAYAQKHYAEEIKQPIPWN